MISRQAHRWKSLLSHTGTVAHLVYVPLSSERRVV